jgi:hypothetical protein
MCGTNTFCFRTSNMNQPSLSIPRGDFNTRRITFIFERKQEICFTIRQPKAKLENYNTASVCAKVPWLISDHFWFP